MRRPLILLAHAAAGLTLRFATIGIGMAVTTEQTAGPLPTAVAFTGFVIVVDVLLVASLILGSSEMFTSLLGTWIAFALIFTATRLTGQAIAWRSLHRPPRAGAAVA